MNDKSVANLFALKSIGKDGKLYEFVCEVTHFYDRYSYRNKIGVKVYPFDRSYNDYFDFKYIILSEHNQVKVTDMFLDFNDYYKSKGLLEALIMNFKEIYPDKKIISNSNVLKKVRNEWRSEAGTKVWERLILGKREIYYSEIDIYALI